jgi:hypothetical protein
VDVTFLILSVALFLGAQSASPELPTLLMPPGNDAWVVRIVTTGGFTGRGSGSLTASSAGEMLCVSVTSCPGRLVPETQRSLSRLITAVPLPDTVAPRSSPLNPGTCSDCVTTTLTLRRRDGIGERTVAYTWDVSTVSTVPEEVLRLHSAIVALAAARSR